MKTIFKVFSLSETFVEDVISVEQKTRILCEEMEGVFTDEQKALERCNQLLNNDDSLVLEVRKLFVADNFKQSSGFIF